MADAKVDVDGDVMTLADDGRAFRIRPAVLFLKVAGDDPDTADLVGRVKDEAALAALGADQYMNSVIVGDTAYDVCCGFIGEPL
ncbi:MAG: hypothetical protein D6689_22795 [Deltaproteobacteria bacterium]|nr:MAG: hypothetical protein D6689_22795 [Deltaproteobacteria bacterium]